MLSFGAAGDHPLTVRFPSPAPMKKAPLWGASLEQATGIEPAASAWEAEVLPLDYACDSIIILPRVTLVKGEAKILIDGFRPIRALFL